MAHPQHSKLKKIIVKDGDKPLPKDATIWYLCTIEKIGKATSYGVSSWPVRGIELEIATRLIRESGY
jgi:hypothetical protein